jgi:Domain of unknown function (DUF1707)
MTELPDRRELRASDSDRDRIAAVLRDAAGDGRLSLEELDERLSAVYAAKTYAELEPVVSDLPDSGAGPSVPITRDAPTSSTGIAIMSGFERKGPWVVPREFTAFAFWGGGQVDLREARFSEPEVTIRVFAIMGGIDVIVPENAEVIVNGVGIMGGFDHGGAGAGTAGGPRITVTGFAFWGGVGVKRKRRKQKNQELNS